MMSPPEPISPNTLSIGSNTQEIANTPCIIRSDLNHLSDLVFGTIVIPNMNVDIAIMLAK